MNEEKIQEFIKEYIAMSIQTYDENYQHKISLFSNQNHRLSQSAIELAQRECRDFLQRGEEDILTVLKTFPITLGMLANDFWMVRSQSKHGFWNRGLSVYGNNLQKLAESYPFTIVKMDYSGNLNYIEKDAIKRKNVKFA